jgi:hypothetical protein
MSRNAVILRGRLGRYLAAALAMTILLGGSSTAMTFPPSPASGSSSSAESPAIPTGQDPTASLNDKLDLLKRHDAPSRGVAAQLGASIGGDTPCATNTAGRGGTVSASPTIELMTIGSIGTDLTTTGFQTIERERPVQIPTSFWACLYYFDPNDDLRFTVRRPDGIAEQRIVPADPASYAPEMGFYVDGLEILPGAPPGRWQLTVSQGATKVTRVLGVIRATAPRQTFVQTGLHSGLLALGGFPPRRPIQLHVFGPQTASSPTPPYRSTASIQANQYGEAVYPLIARSGTPAGCYLVTSRRNHQTLSNPPAQICA